jgi:hypothetical protein
MTDVDAQAEHVVCGACGAESRQGYVPAESACPELSSSVIRGVIEQPHKWVRPDAGTEGDRA